MKIIITIISTLLTLSAFAMEVDVISAEYQVENEIQEKTLCLTIVKIPATGETFGIVEDIGDCFYARKARHNLGLPLELDPKYLSPVNPDLDQHLQMLVSDLKFYFSDGE